MEEEQKKRIESIIKNELKNESVFCLRDGLRFVPNHNAFELKEEVVQLLLANGKLSDQDFFLLASISSVGIATVPIIMRKIAYEKSKNPQMAFPTCDTRQLKNKLRSLVQNGLLYSFTYDGNENTKVIIYFCTMLGWRACRTHLMTSIPFDRQAMYRSTSDIFRKLASNTMAFSFISSTDCKEIKINENVTYGDDTHPKRMNIYARATIEREERKREFIIEPVYFKVEPELITDEDNQQNIVDRITQLQKMIEFYMDEQQRNLKIIFLVEDLTGLLKLANLLKTFEMSFFIDHALFTSENVLAKNQYHVDTIFLKIVPLNEKYGFVLDEESLVV